MAPNKTFWTKPEGMTGALFLAAIVAGLGYLGLNFLPSLTEILSNTLYLVATIGVLSGVVFLAIDKQARNIVSNAYQSFMRAITGVFVRMDPISVLNSFLDELADNINELSLQIGQLRSEMRNLKSIMDGNESDMKMNLLLAEKARAKNDKKGLIIASRKAGRLQESNRKYAALKKQMNYLYQVLTRMYEHAEILHEDTRDQIAIKTIEYKAIQSSQKAMQGAKEIISGSNKKELFELSMQAITEDLAQKSGEMERFMDLSKNFMDTMDLQNAEFESEGLELLQNFESSLLEGTHLDLTQQKPNPELLDREDDRNEYEGLF